jgi:hypothetical protein
MNKKRQNPKGGPELKLKEQEDQNQNGNNMLRTISHRRKENEGKTEPDGETRFPDMPHKSGNIKGKRIS